MGAGGSELGGGAERRAIACERALNGWYGRQRARSRSSAAAAAIAVDTVGFRRGFIRTPPHKITPSQ
jgi:hypothetical protein